MKKGMSPVVAAVLLIVITIAIAGILASFATTLTTERLEGAGDIECIGAIDISSLQFSEDIISFKIRNVARINLEGITAVIEYANISKNSQTPVFITVLSPGETKFPTIDTDDMTKPLRIEVISTTCPRNSALLNFR